jgi:hypothetical protein
MSDNTTNKIPQKKVIPNSLRLKSAGKNSFNGSINQRNMANILNRLPFLNQLKEAKNSLLKISPIWQKWCDSQLNTSSLTSSPDLKSFHEGELTISCETPIIASLIKHQQNSLLQTFHAAGLNNIQRIKTQVQLDYRQNDDQQSSLHSTAARHDTLEGTDSSTEQQLTIDKTRKKPNSDALKSIKATQSHTKNEQLVASLQRLADTLNDLP